MAKVRKLIALTIAAFLTLSCKTATFADNGNVEVPDLSRKGSIKITVLDTTTKKPVAGGELILYKVADVKEDDGNYTFEYTSSFESCGFALSFENQNLASNLSNYANNKKLEGKTEKVNAEGVVVFGDLDLGLYMIRQTRPSAGYEPLSAFLVTVPLRGEDGSYQYDIVANPKPGTADLKPVTSPKPDAPKDEKAPQSGQLWWPVILLLGAGAVFIVGGIIIPENKRR